jgi:hypothetical protein
VTFKRPIRYKGSAVVDATDFVIAYANDEHIAARIADALTNYGGSYVTRSEIGTSSELHQCGCTFTATGDIVDECGYHLRARVAAIEKALKLTPSSIGTVDPAIAFNDWWDREVEGGLMLSAPRLKETAWRAWQASSGTSRPSREY